MQMRLCLVLERTRKKKMSVQFMVQVVGWIKITGEEGTSQSSLSFLTNTWSEVFVQL